MFVCVETRLNSHPHLIHACCHFLPCSEMLSHLTFKVLQFFRNINIVPGKTKKIVRNIHQDSSRLQQEWKYPTLIPGDAVSPNVSQPIDSGIRIPSGINDYTASKVTTKRTNHVDDMSFGCRGDDIRLFGGTKASTIFPN